MGEQAGAAFFTLHPPPSNPKPLQVRYIGVSNETSFGVMSFEAAAKLHGLPKIQTIQNSFSLLVRDRFETDLTEVRSARGVPGVSSFPTLVPSGVLREERGASRLLAPRGRCAQRQVH